MSSEKRSVKYFDYNIDEIAQRYYFYFKFRTITRC